MVAVARPDMRPKKYPTARPMQTLAITHGAIYSSVSVKMFSLALSRLDGAPTIIACIAGAAGGDLPVHRWCDACGLPGWCGLTPSDQGIHCAKFRERDLFGVSWSAPFWCPQLEIKSRNVIEENANSSLLDAAGFDVRQSMRHIYLDYNATTPIAPSVQEAMLPFLTEHHGNPASHHALGRACAEAMEDARAHVAQMLGAEPDEIVFTGCGTESNNLALKGVLLAQPPSAGGHLVISAIEHPAISEPADWLTRWGYDVTVVPCDGNGLVNPDDVRAAIRPTTRLVSVMHANNETGVVQPIAQIGKICRDHEVLLHTDAAQSIGKIRTHVDELHVDLLTIAGHKLYAPKGIGALYVRSGTPLVPMQHGAGHESGLRAGTENVPYIVALGKAARLAAQAVDRAADQMEALRDRLHWQLREAVGGGLTVNGMSAPRLPNTLSVNFSQVAGEELLNRAPEVCASTGAACHSGATTVSATLAAMGVPADVARGTVRLSVGWYTSQEEIDRAASLLIEAWESQS